MEPNTLAAAAAAASCGAGVAVPDLAPVDEEAAEKQFEVRLSPTRYTLFRLDGVTFSTFVRRAKLQRPFDAKFSAWMRDACEAVVVKYRFDACFCGSDEMTFVWHPQPLGPDGVVRSMRFLGRVTKLCSVLAGEATAAFLQAVAADSPDVLKLRPCFDCRVWQVDTLAECHRALHRRQLYTLRNARMMYAQAHFSHSALQGVSSAAAAAMVPAKHGPAAAFEAFVDEFTRIGGWCTLAPAERTVDTRAGPVVVNRPVIKWESVFNPHGAIVELAAKRKPHHASSATPKSMVGDDAGDDAGDDPQ
jgi:tRNA(His) 5'-end guanylyltransferase